MTLGEIVKQAMDSDHAPVELLHECVTAAKRLEARRGSPAHTRLEFVTQQWTPDDVMWFVHDRPDRRKPTHVGIIVWVPTDFYEAATGTVAHARSKRAMTTLKRQRNLSTAEGLMAACKASDASVRRLRVAGIGATVELTDEALVAGIARTRLIGKITGWGRDKWNVQVRPTGLKTASRYHVDFWRPVK